MLSPETKAVINSELANSIYLYEVYYSETEPPKRWAAWDIDVVYDGNVYERSAIKHSELTQSTDGKINDVTLTVGNADRVIQYLIETYDLIKKPIRILEIFEGVDECISHTYTIKAAKTKKDSAIFTLSIGFDFLKLEVPARKVSSRICGWDFKGTDGACGYAGPDTTCDHTWEDCKAKGNVSRIGCFPGVINERIYF